jgi:hypothetical protein
MRSFVLCTDQMRAGGNLQTPQACHTSRFRLLANPTSMPHLALLSPYLDMPIAKRSLPVNFAQPCTLATSRLPCAVDTPHKCDINQNTMHRPKIISHYLTVVVTIREGHAPQVELRSARAFGLEAVAVRAGHHACPPANKAAVHEDVHVVATQVGAHHIDLP